jgi:hypothetical protein
LLYLATPLVPHYGEWLADEGRSVSRRASPRPVGQTKMLQEHPVSHHHQRFDLLVFGKRTHVFEQTWMSIRLATEQLQYQCVLDKRFQKSLYGLPPACVIADICPDQQQFHRDKRDMRMLENKMYAVI